MKPNLESGGRFGKWYVDKGCMVRPPKMAILLLSVHPLLHQGLLQLHPAHMTDLPTYLLRPQLVIILAFRSEHLHHDSLSKGR